MATTITPRNIWFPTQPPQPEQANNDGQILISAVLSLIFVVALVILLHLYIRHVIHRRTRRPVINTIISQNQLSSTENLGLDPSLFPAIPTFTYAKKHEDESTAECSVCLVGIAEGEVVRLLPKCKHVFHASCIDVWLRSHATCPLCRAKVEVDEIKPLGMERPVLGLKEGGLGSARFGESLRRMWSGRSRVVHGDGAVVEDIERLGGD